MDTKQTNYLIMAITTDDTCGENEALWTSLPAFASEIALARTHIASIRRDSQAQLGADSKPHTKAKDDAKKSLARLAADTGAPASVHAQTTGNLPAAAQLNQSYSDIYYATVLRRVRTLSLEDLFDKLRAVHSRMDRLPTVLRTTAPEFFTAYESARVIIDRPATQEDPVAPPSPPPA